MKEWREDLSQEGDSSEANQGGEWIVTFADLMTLLFCFFVLLTTLSTAPKNCNGLAKYLEENHELFKNFELRNSKLECMITLPSDYLFHSGEDQVQERALERLQKLFETIGSLPEHEKDLIVVEGHTDNVPIHTRRFRSNWNLSSARATTVANFLIGTGFPDKRISVRAFADQRPRESYNDDSGNPLAGVVLSRARGKNRRVEIILANRPTRLDEYGLLFK